MSAAASKGYANCGILKKCAPAPSAMLVKPVVGAFPGLLKNLLNALLVPFFTPQNTQAISPGAANCKFDPFIVLAEPA
ncbi:hypothetical protein CKO_01889 [Citrobacter koseri ATCC BAA-895]|uniref:Uncharacterized protein n=1 Tax=Citrobacter koseri (strain ATCC BAA-895 / CDC 4225-83 / SGSC4696) TaxID=290338 RepID=A8AHQ3_CITK8|nr:hypothetical protein CKO_01889 [Citrobacter koseri ATCC BAA-895]